MYKQYEWKSLQHSGNSRTAVSYQVEGSTAADAAAWQTTRVPPQSSTCSLAGPWTLRSQSEWGWSQHIRCNLQQNRTAQRRPGRTRTRLSRATASEMDVLKSSGLFWASVVMRLVAAVTTPWKRGGALNKMSFCTRCQFKVCKAASSYRQSTSSAKTHKNWLTKDRSQEEKQQGCVLTCFGQMRLVVTLSCKHHTDSVDEG